MALSKIWQKFKGKHLCGSRSCGPRTLFNKRLRQRWFSVKFAIFLRTPILENFRERLFLSYNHLSAQKDNLGSAFEQWGQCYKLFFQYCYCSFMHKYIVRVHLFFLYKQLGLGFIPQVAYIFKVFWVQSCLMVA